jgi:hypothetical protein
MLKAKVRRFTVYWPNYEKEYRTELEAIGRATELIASRVPYVLVIAHE